MAATTQKKKGLNLISEHDSLKNKVSFEVMEVPGVVKGKVSSAMFSDFFVSGTVGGLFLSKEVVQTQQ